MCSASITLWFVCKSCQRSFQNLTAFIEHKKKDHFPEFQKLNCIVFEENNNYSNFNLSNLGNLPSTMSVAVKEEEDPLGEENSNENTDPIVNDPLVVQNYPPKSIDAAIDEEVSADSTEFITADVENEPTTHIAFEPPTEEFDFTTEHSVKNEEEENLSNSSDNEPNFLLEDVKPEILEPMIEIVNFENENDSDDDDSYYHNSSANFYGSDATPSTSFDLNSILQCDLELDLECRLCHNVLSSEMELKTHVQACFLTSKKTASYCLDCNRHLPTSRELKLHKKQIHGFIDPNSASEKKVAAASAANKPPLFKCQHCTKQFLLEADLNQHSESHSAEFPFKCTTANCTKAFETLTKLKVHYVTHYNLQRFKCSFPHCNKSYKYKKSIVEHERVHTGERPYRCTEQHCDLTFFNSSELRRHKVSWHGQT